MLSAGMATILCHLLKQPIILGYIIAGIIIGPHTPPFSFITDITTIQTLAELGVIFLMFSLGMEFDLHKLKKVGMVSLIAAIFEIVLMIGIGYKVGISFGWSQMDSIFLGGILSISSTTIIVKALNELDIKNEYFAQLIFGILIIEDIFAILILALLSSIAVTGSLQIKDMVFESIKLSSFLILILVIGLLSIPRLLKYIAKFKSPEVTLISVLGLCFGISLLMIKMKYSVALGSFLMGAIIAESSELYQIERLIIPIRDTFSAIFFVSVGLLFNLSIVKDNSLAIAVITLVVIIGKIVSCSLGVLVSGRDGKTAMRTGMGLAQIGEFSFIIASLGMTLNATSEFLYSIAVGVSIITTLLTPYLLQYSDPFTKLISNFIPKKISLMFKSYVNWVQMKK